MVKPVVLICMKVISVIVFTFTILSSYGGHVNPQYLATPSLLCLVMPYMAFLCFILIAFWAVMRKIIFTALGVLTIIICLPSLSQAIPLGVSKKASPGAETFTIISWNILHTEDIRKPDYPGNRAVEFLVNSDADIICFAELYNFTPKELRKASRALIDSLTTIYPYKAGFNSSDIKVISKYPVKRMRMSYHDISGYRFDFFKVYLPQDSLVVAMTHLYSYGLSDEERNVVTEIKSMETAKESVREFKGSILHKMKTAFRKRADNATELRGALDEIPLSQPLIVCGDFNDVPASWTYNIIRGDDMKDAYSETNFGPAFTYNLHRFYFHIDQMLYRGNIKALDLKVGKINTSDHYPLIGTFEFVK